MNECDYCSHCEMCRWIKDVEEQGCEFFDDNTGWVSVQERLPVEDGTLRGYLVSIKNWVGIANFVDGEFWEDYLQQARFNFPVQAWKYMPDSYEELMEERKKANKTSDG